MNSSLGHDTRKQTQRQRKPPLLGLALAMAGLLLSSDVQAQRNKASEKQLQRLLRNYPAADVNKDGKLTWQEAQAYRRKITGGGAGRQETGGNAGRGVQRSFKVGFQDTG